MSGDSCLGDLVCSVVVEKATKLGLLWGWKARENEVLDSLKDLVAGLIICGHPWTWAKTRGARVKRFTWKHETRSSSRCTWDARSWGSTRCVHSPEDAMQLLQQALQKLEPGESEGAPHMQCKFISEMDESSRIWRKMREKRWTHSRNLRFQVLICKLVQSICAREQNKKPHCYFIVPFIPQLWLSLSIPGLMILEDGDKLTGKIKIHLTKQWEWTGKNTLETARKLMCCQAYCTVAKVMGTTWRAEARYQEKYIARWRSVNRAWHGCLLDDCL